MLASLSMKPDSPSPAAHLVRFGVATSRGAFRAFLRHAWLQTTISQDPARGSEVFDEVIAKSGTQFPVGVQPWAGVLARALQRVARLFADEGLAIRFATSAAGAGIAPILNAIAPLCADMDSELETSGFEVQLGESEMSVRTRLAAHLPDSPFAPSLGAARVWWPDFFSGMMVAALWREIVAEEPTMKLAAVSACEFFTEVMNKLGVPEQIPSASAIEQTMLAFAPKAVEYGLGQISWLLEPGNAAELESKVLPFLRAAFARETPPPPVLASASAPPVPIILPNAAPVKSNGPQAPQAAQSAQLVQALSANVSPPAPLAQPPALRPVPKPKVEPSEPAHADEDEDEEVLPQKGVRDVRWIIAGIGGVLLIVALLPFLNGGGLDIGSGIPGASVDLTPVPVDKGPERMVIAPVDPLQEPVAVTVAPSAPPLLFERAQNYIDAAARAKVAGDNRQAAEDLSRAMLIFKQEFGEQRWRDQRYIDLRNEYRAQLALLELSKEQILLVEDIVGARESIKPEPAGSHSPELVKAVANFRRGDEEITRRRPKAAAEAYEQGLRMAIEVLGPRRDTDRTYQQLLSRYIDFLIGENLAPDQLHNRLSLVKSGKKPGPLPDKKQEPENGGLGLPRQ